MDYITWDCICRSWSYCYPYYGVSQVARVLTLTVLRSLDASHNKIVLKFLHDAQLLGRTKPVIDLSFADLSNDDLRGVDLSGIELGLDNLSHANLSGANIY